MSAIRTLITEDLAYLDLRPEVMDAFNTQLQTELRQTSWAATGDSWYKDAEGRITNNWPYSTLWYWWCTRSINRQDYRAERRTAASRVVAGTSATAQAAA